MTNRNRFYPILLSATLSLATVPLVPTYAEPGVPAESAGSAPVAPAPTAAAKIEAAPTSAITPAPAAAPAVTPAAAPTTPAVSDVVAPENRPPTYTVLSGDSYWTIAQKFGITVKALKKANNATKNALKPEQVLKLPPAKKAKASAPTADAPATTAPTTKPDASAAPKKKTHQKVYAKAQPVQDFDVPASTFASCPVPDPASVPDKPSHADQAAFTTPADMDTTPTSAPVAQLVSPQELDADAPKTVATETAAPKPVAPAPTPAPLKRTPAPVVAATKPVPVPIPASVTQPNETDSTPAPAATSTFASSSSKSGHPSFFASLFGSSSSSSSSSGDWAGRFMQEAKQLSDVGLSYDENWRPPGESRAWAMDCSNTSRYLYKVTANLDLPRTASDQYYYLHLQGKAWDVPVASDGYADGNYLRANLKPGDLLFWENTYRPERQPPITHVMIYLGTNDKGEWLMVGSQSSHGGMHNRRGGGPDIYVFDPHKASGGYTTWLGLVKHKGRFCAYGRPLEANPAKLSVASN